MLNQMLEALGKTTLTDWKDESHALATMMIPVAWQYVGFYFVISETGLNSISSELYESAMIDGANRWQQFVHITWPMLSPTTFFIFTMSVIGSFQVFSQVYMMTPRGGPLKSTMVVVYYLYRKAFDQFEFGYALAMAFVLFLIIFACTLFNKLYVEKKVHYS